MTPPLRIGLFGFGQTGRLAAKEILNDPDCELTWVVRRQWGEHDRSASQIMNLAGHRGELLTTDDVVAPDFFPKHAVDCIVDFSSETGVKLYRHAAEHGIRIVSAVSHYDESGLTALGALSERTAVLWSPNITLGINFIMTAGKIFRTMMPGADVQIVEEHFSAKRGVSGTALRIAEALNVNAEESVRSVRAGGIVGKHEIIFGMPNQTIRLVHESISRAVFGRSALLAAKWLRDKPAGFYSMEDMMRDHIRTAVG